MNRTSEDFRSMWSGAGDQEDLIRLRCSASQGE